ncbi:MAG: response regulator [Thermodesulfobacteriota bacterium]|nr:response regulator [Thermodesulfobacteriota bacterium]
MERNHTFEPRGYRLLIVDDELVTREMVRNLLEDEGYVVDVTENGFDAFDIINRSVPDLILLDIMMPVLNGFDMCRMLKAEDYTRDIPVIFVTALDDKGDEEMGLKLGGVDYITKPISEPILKARIRTHLELKQHRKNLQDLVEERSRELLKKTDELAAKEMMMRNLFEAMGEMLATRDHYTFEHVLRVAAISVRIGTEMGFSEDELKAMELGCLVHDIGKVAIPDDVLFKPGRFNPQDRRIMEYHPVMGAKLFSKHIEDVRIKEIILYHHERLDGSGYPAGLKGDEIGMHVRVVAVADVFEALIASRPYKRPMTREKALSILHGDAERGVVDPSVVDALEKVTESWDPLEITREFVGDYVNDLEMFRKVAYFREPLSDFYNYRFIFFLDELNLLRKHRKPYHIILTDFMHMRRFNQEVGYARADEILLKIGKKLQETTKKFNISGGSFDDNTAILFRKGPDYLIYSEVEGEYFDEFTDQLNHNIDNAIKENGIDIRVVTKCFEKDRSAEDALNEIFLEEMKHAEEK